MLEYRLQATAIKQWWASLFKTERQMPQSYPPTLAQELVDVVIDAVASSCSYDYFARETLRRCSLVNKTFLPRCRMHLFSEVRFNIQYTQSARMQSFLELLEHPLSQIAPYVQTLQLRDAFWEPELPKILPFLRNLRSLHLRVRPGTTPWSSFNPAFKEALLQTMALQSLEELHIRGFTALPPVLFASSPNLKKLDIRDSTLVDDWPPSEARSTPYSPLISPTTGSQSLPPTMSKLPLRSPSPQLTALGVQESFPLILPLFNENILSPSKLAQVDFVATVHSDVDVVTQIVSFSSATISKFSFSNRLDDALPDICLSSPDFPSLQVVNLELRAQFQDCHDGLPTSLRTLLLGISPNSPIKKLNIRIRWESCNPDVPWNNQAISDSWDEVDTVLSRLESLKSVSIVFIVGYCNGKDEWAAEEIMSLEDASDGLDTQLARLFKRTSSRDGVQTRVYRDSF